MEITPELQHELAALPPGFWGTVELVIQNGELVVLKTLTTKKMNKERESRHARSTSR